jgi:hypothetical protein
MFLLCRNYDTIVKQLLGTLCVQISRKEQSRLAPKRSTRTGGRARNVFGDKPFNLPSDMDGKAIVEAQSAGDAVNTAGAVFHVFHKLVRCLTLLLRRDR